MDALASERLPTTAPGSEEEWLDRLFLAARTFNGWQDRPVSRAVIERVYELARMGPTSANSSPGRFIFVTTPEAKARLLPHLSKDNQAKTLAAPVNVIVAYDRDFAEYLPTLFPHAPKAALWFSDPAVAEESAFRNSSLQAAYLILAARALGLDAGPLSGFDRAGVDQAFFAGTDLTTNFIVNLGYGRREDLTPRLPRLTFEQACRIA